MVTFSGVMPANILPFKADLSIDEPAYRAHLRWLSDERKRSLAVALDEVGSACPIVAGVYSDGTAEAVELARDAKALGAAAVLVFPPTLFMWGAQLKPDMVVRPVSAIAEKGDVPIILFEYPPASGIGYAPETLARLAPPPHVVGVKDWSNEM